MKKKIKKQTTKEVQPSEYYIKSKQHSHLYIDEKQNKKIMITICSNIKQPNFAKNKFLLKLNFTLYELKG